MGKAAEDFDGQITPIRISYLRAIGYNNWILGCHVVYMMNMAISQKNRVNPLPQFKQEGVTYRSELINEQKAKEYCLEWAPIVEAAISRERDQLLFSYK